MPVQENQQKEISVFLRPVLFPEYLIRFFFLQISVKLHLKK